MIKLRMSFSMRPMFVICSYNKKSKFRCLAIGSYVKPGAGSVQGMQLPRQDYGCQP